MSSEHDGRRLGVPPQSGPIFRAGADEARPAPHPDTQRVGLGVPRQTAERATELSDADRARLRQTRDAADLADEEAWEAAERGGIPLPKFLFHPALICLFAAAAGLVLLYVCGQTLSLLTDLRAAGTWPYRIGAGGLLLLAGMVAVSVVGLAVCYARLSRNRQIRLRYFSQLAERHQLQRLAREKLAEARDRLHDYLESYPLDAPRTRRFLTRMGLAEADLDRLGRARERLLEAASFGGTTEWVDEFARDFQHILDTAATQRVQQAARAVGIKTAVSWLPLVDLFAVLYHGFELCADLSRIYNLRMGRADTLVFLVRLFLQAYGAARIDELEERAVEEAQGVLSEALGDTTASGAEGTQAAAGAARTVTSGLAGGLLGRFGLSAAAKVGAGMLNYLLITSLGRRCMRMLQPVR